MRDEEYERQKLIAQLQSLAKNVPPGVNSGIPCEKWTIEELKAATRQAKKITNKESEAKGKHSFDAYWYEKWKRVQEQRSVKPKGVPPSSSTDSAQDGGGGRSSRLNHETSTIDERLRLLDEDR